MSQSQPLYLLKCRPSFSGQQPFSQADKLHYLSVLSPSWKLSECTRRLLFNFKTTRFSESFDLATLIAKMAEIQNHHPILQISPRSLQCEIWTHQIDDLVEADYVFASKVDKIVEEKYT